MNYELIAARLAAAGLGIVGETIFIHHMPADVAEGILLRGPLTGIPYDPYLPGLYKTQFQVVIRAQAHAVGNAKAKAVVDALSSKSGYDLIDPATSALSMRIHNLLPETLPIVFPRLEGNGIEWSIHFDIRYVQM